MLGASHQAGGVTEDEAASLAAALPDTTENKGKTSFSNAGASVGIQAGVVQGNVTINQSVYAELMRT